MRRLLVGCVVLALALGSGRAYAAEEGSPAEGSFGPTGSLIEPRAWHSAILLPDGRVFVVGGEGVYDTVDDEGNETIGLIHHTAEIWNPATGTFSRAGSHGSCGWDPAALLPDGHVLIAGTCIVRVPVVAELWDPVTESFSMLGALEEVPRHGPRTVLSDGRVLFVGGMGYEEDSVLAAATIWDPLTGSFTPAGSLEKPRQGHTATLLRDGRVLVAGGLGPFGADTSLAEVWDPETTSFGPAGQLVNGTRFRHTATLLSDGRVLIVGGHGHDGVLVTAEIWDPETTSFTPAGSLAEGREGQGAAHTATLLPDGRVLVVGGFGPGVLASAELWDPLTESFAPAGSMVRARAQHSATLLHDGRVLVVGGLGGDDEFLASAEIWRPEDA